MSQDKKQQHQIKEPSGLGDSVYNLIHNSGLDRLVKKDKKPCSRCEKRRKKLNKWVPYKTN